VFEFQNNYGKLVTILITSVICVKKIGSGTLSDTKFVHRKGSVSYTNARKEKVSELRYGLRSSEKELPEPHFGAFRHKIPLLVTN
jgi:hypothetical protein